MNFFQAQGAGFVSPGVRRFGGDLGLGVDEPNRLGPG